MSMDLDEIAGIVRMMREQDLVELELERDGVRVRLRRAEPGGGSGVAARPAPTAVSGAGDLLVVPAPVVGTFYRASAPDASPFVEVGASVSRGDVLGIIEAMKLMNEITAQVDGEVVEICADNGQAVQYGQRLFTIRAR